MSTNSILERFERHLHELLALLDGEAASDAALERAWRSCESDARALTTLERVGELVDDDARRDLRARLERLTTLNAVAREAALRESERVARSLASVRATRGGLRDLASAPVLGESCDIAG